MEKIHQVVAEGEAALHQQPERARDSESLQAIETLRIFTPPKPFGEWWNVDHVKAASLWDRARTAKRISVDTARMLLAWKAQQAYNSYGQYQAPEDPNPIGRTNRSRRR